MKFALFEFPAEGNALAIGKTSIIRNFSPELADNYDFESEITVEWKS